ncbi:MAG: hypothetical protein WA682_06565, partial [Acidobacteriaceae bacterium]
MKLLLPLWLALCGLTLHAQSGTYAGSEEYQAMLQELHAPAPSPIFLATGVRPLPEPGLKVQVHNTRSTLQLKTSWLQIAIDRPAATLTLLNLQTRASWALNPGPAASITNITRQQNMWTLSVLAADGDSTLTLE